jgi:hypothetical protein
LFDLKFFGGLDVFIFGRRMFELLQLAIQAFEFRQVVLMQPPFRQGMLQAPFDTDIES